MPFGVKPSCSKCAAPNSEIWHKTKDGNAICNACYGLLGIPKPVTLVKAESAVKQPEKVPQFEGKTLTEEAVILTAEVDESLVEELLDDTKTRNDGGPGTRSGNSSSTRGGKSGPRKTRGRAKKLGAVTKTTVAKGRGRRAVFKKQVCSDFYSSALY